MRLAGRSGLRGGTRLRKGRLHTRKGRGGGRGRKLRF